MKELLFRLSNIQVINQMFLGPQMYNYILGQLSPL